MTFLVGSLATDEHFATCLFFQTLLIDPLGADQETDKVDALIAWQVDLRLVLLVPAFVKACDLARHDECLADSWNHQLASFRYLGLKDRVCFDLLNLSHFQFVRFCKSTRHGHGFIRRLFKD
jgi:hypothetical protein